MARRIFVAKNLVSEPLHATALPEIFLRIAVLLSYSDLARIVVPKYSLLNSAGAAPSTDFIAALNFC